MMNDIATDVPIAPMDARMVRTRTALRNALLALIQRKPFEQISIRDIVAEAAIGYATFFRHYPGKEALIEDVASVEVEGLFALTLPARTSGGNRASAMALCHYVDSKRAIWTALLTGGAVGVMREEFIRIARDVGTREIQSSSWLPTELGVVLGVSGAFEVLSWWLRQPVDYPIDKVAELLDRLVISPPLARD